MPAGLLCGLFVAAALVACVAALVAGHAFGILLGHAIEPTPLR